MQESVVCLVIVVELSAVAAGYLVQAAAVAVHGLEVQHDQVEAAGACPWTFVEVVLSIDHLSFRPAHPQPGEEAQEDLLPESPEVQQVHSLAVHSDMDHTRRHRQLRYELAGVAVVHEVGQWIAVTALPGFELEVVEVELHEKQDLALAEVLEMPGLERTKASHPQ